MFAGDQRLTNLEIMSHVRTDLPIYTVVGDQDPLHRPLALLKELVKRFETAGVTDIIFKVYPEAHHEVLNEMNRDAVVKDILTWLERII